jgi:hypothetical protein
MNASVLAAGAAPPKPSHAEDQNKKEERFHCSTSSCLSSSASYGTPPPGSSTERRGKEAHQTIGQEVLDLCHTIIILFSSSRQDSAEEKTRSQRGCAEDGGNTNEIIRVRFGDLFEWYEHKNNKVVGLLLRAKRHGLVEFDKEMLFQGQDDDVIIGLQQDNYNQILAARRKTNKYQGGEEKEDKQQLKSSFTWGDALSG